jgi:tRNA A37 threonylcarbamoyladenosine dehydratase
MASEKGIFQRTELLLGREMMNEIATKNVILFGIGGVGSWCAESLIRTGIRKLTIVDSDRIAESNINRQLHATTQTIGEVKTETLKKRLLEINPYAEINALQKIYNEQNHSFFELEKYDYIIDAIDSIGSKAHLIRMATRTKAVFFSSMGASLKLDPTKISVAEFWKVKGCPLASRMRRVLKKGELPAKKFLCVFSEELLENKGSGVSFITDEPVPETNNLLPGDPELANHDWSTKKAVINGTVAHITAIYGFTLAGLVINDIYNSIETSIKTATE